MNLDRRRTDVLRASKNSSCSHGKPTTASDAKRVRVQAGNCQALERKRDSLELAQQYGEVQILAGELCRRLHCRREDVAV